MWKVERYPNLNFLGISSASRISMCWVLLKIPFLNPHEILTSKLGSMEESGEWKACSNVHLSSLVISVLLSVFLGRIQKTTAFGSRRNRKD